MLNVKEKTKKVYLYGGKKTITFEIGENIYTSDDLLQNSFSLKESICSDKDLYFDRVESSEAKFTLVDFKQDIDNLSGQQVYIYQTIIDEVVPFGRFIIESAKRKDEDLAEIIAYDYLHKFSINVQDWWNNETFPISHRNLLISLCQYCGVEHNIPQSYVNSDFMIEQNILVENTSGTHFLGYLQEVSGSFYKVNRQGVLISVDLKKINGLKPRQGLYPNKKLYPSSSYTTQYDSFTGQVMDMNVSQYETQKIEKLQVRANNNDIGVIVGDGTNTYVIQANPLLYGMDSVDLRSIAQNIFNKIKLISYIPFSGTLKGLPYVEVGDYIQIKTKKRVINSFLLSRTINGSMTMQDAVSTQGQLNRIQNASTNQQIQVLNQKTLEITQNVEKLEFKMIDVADGLQSQITQTAKGVTIQSQQFAYRNLLVNSDFKFITDNKLDCWLDYNTGKLNKTIIDDDDFPNGYALQLKKNEVVSDVIYQEFDINKNIGGLFLALDIKPIILNYSIRGIIYVKYENEGFNAVFSNESYQPELNVYKRIKFTFNLDKNKKVETIGVRPFNITSEISDVLINRVFLTYDTPYPMVDMWNDIPSNYLIPTLNLSPKGSALLQANKVDIKGFTTIYNPDGSSYTQIDGSTIRTANLVGLKTVNGTVVNATGDISVFNWDGSIIKFRFENGIVVGWQYVAGSKKGMVNQSYLIVKNNQIYCQKWYDGNGGEISGEKPVVVYNGLLFASGEI